MASRGLIERMRGERNTGRDGKALWPRFGIPKSFGRDTASPHLHRDQPGECQVSWARTCQLFSRPNGQLDRESDAILTQFHAIDEKSQRLRCFGLGSKATAPCACGVDNRFCPTCVKARLLDLRDDRRAIHRPRLSAAKRARLLDSVHQGIERLQSEVSNMSDELTQSAMESTRASRHRMMAQAETGAAPHTADQPAANLQPWRFTEYRGPVAAAAARLQSWRATSMPASRIAIARLI